MNGKDLGNKNHKVHRQHKEDLTTCTDAWTDICSLGTCPTANLSLAWPPALYTCGPLIDSLWYHPTSGDCLSLNNTIARKYRHI